MTNFENKLQAAKKDISSTDVQSRIATDSRALQDIIEIMNEPFMTSCDTCNGLGFIRSGEDCPTCSGSGKLLDELFK